MYIFSSCIKPGSFASFVHRAIREGPEDSREQFFLLGYPADCHDQAQVVMCIHKDTYINVPCSALYSKNTGPCLKGKFNHLAIFFSVIEGAWGMSALFCFNLVFSIFFTMMVTKHWHSLLREVVESPSLEKVTSNFGNQLLVALLEQRGWTRWPPEAPSSSAIL